MNKKDLINFVAEATKLGKRKSNRVVDAVFNGIASGLKADQNARFIGFGSFFVTKKAERKGRNPRTGKEILIAPTNRLTFKVSGKLKKTINP